MKITENFMLGTNRDSVNSKVAYKSIHKDKLNPTICVKWDQPDRVLSFSQFAIGNVEAWSPVIFKSKDLIKTSSEPIKHRIYNKDEIEFLLAYEEYKKLDLDLLLKLSEEHSRCTFVVKEKEFLDLFSALANFSGNFKYIHEKQVFKDLTGINSNCILLVSFYDMNTFMFDLYGKKPKGLGISFEFLNKEQSNTFPYVYSGVYLLLTNEYEGVFYKDGQVQLAVNNVDFKTSYENIKYVINTASSEQNEKILSPTINFGHQENELITNDGFEITFERPLKVTPRKKKKLKINYHLNSSYPSGSKKVSSPHREDIFKKQSEELGLSFKKNNKNFRKETVEEATINKIESSDWTYKVREYENNIVESPRPEELDNYDWANDSKNFENPSIKKKISKSSNKILTRKDIEKIKNGNFPIPTEEYKGNNFEETLKEINKKHTSSHRVKKSKHIPPRLKSKKISTGWGGYSFDNTSTVSVSITSDTSSTTY